MWSAHEQQVALLTSTKSDGDREATGEAESGGRGCLGEGCLGLPGQVWEPSFPSYLRENRSSKNVWENACPRHTSSRHPRPSDRKRRRVRGKKEDGEKKRKNKVTKWDEEDDQEEVDQEENNQEEKEEEEWEDEKRQWEREQEGREGCTKSKG